MHALVLCHIINNFLAELVRSQGCLFIYLFIMLCQFHTIISAQIQTQEYTNYQSINGRVYATALRQLQQPLQNEHDTFYMRSLVI